MRLDIEDALNKFLAIGEESPALAFLSGYEAGITRAEEIAEIALRGTADAILKAIEEYNG